MNRFLPGAWLMLVLGFSISIQSAFAQLQEPRWDEGFSAYGVEGEAQALVLGSGGELYMAGEFNFVGGLPVYGIAMWDGLLWSALGGGLGEGSSGLIYTLALDNAGNLYVGGDFFEVVQPNGNVLEVNNLAMWNGSSWEALGTGVNDVVYALAVGSDGVVYIGGAFTQDGADEFELSKVAAWDNGALTALGNGLGTVSTVEVQALTFDGSGTLHAGGSDLPGGIFRWTGQTWEAIGAQHDGVALSMAFDANDNLYVGGDFQMVIQSDNSELMVNRIARWNGTSWEAVGDGVDDEVRALQVDGSGAVYAAGPFLANGDGSQARSNIARWDGSWSTVGSGVGEDGFETINALVLTGTGGLYAAGDVQHFGSTLGNGIAYWDGAAWNTVGGGAGLDSDLYAFALDAQGGLIAGGNFSYAGHVHAEKIARWFEGAWSPIGGGVTDGAVYAVAVASNGDIYAAGDFESALQPDGSSLLAYGIAKWDGAAWSALGTGFNGPVDVLQLDNAGNLYAGGDFTMDGSEQTAMPYLAMWNGTQWTVPGGGTDGPVNAMTVQNNGTLLVGGQFTSAGSVGNTGFLAAWDGAAWAPISPSTLLNEAVYALEIGAGNVVLVGGAFTQVADGVDANYVAQWDGANWSLLGLPTGNGASGCCVYALAQDNTGRIFAGGDFSGVRRPVGPDIQASNIASWTVAGGWQPLDLGLNQAVEAMLASGEDLFVAGAFTAAGSTASSFIGRWSRNISLVSVEDELNPLPNGLAISSIYPNPARNSAEMTFSVNSAQHVDVDVFDTLGRRVAKIFAGHVPADQTQALYLGSTDWPAGVYIVRISGERTTATRTLVWVK